jgi:hypothetical protein
MPWHRAVCFVQRASKREYRGRHRRPGGWMPFQIRRSVRVYCEMRGTSFMCKRASTYGSSGNSGEILVEVVIGGRHCSCALSEDSDLSCFRDTCYRRKTWARGHTLQGSPPNDAMLTCTHSRAVHWSYRPRLSTPRSTASGP